MEPDEPNIFDILNNVVPKNNVNEDIKNRVDELILRELNKALLPDKDTLDRLLLIKSLGQ